MHHWGRPLSLLAGSSSGALVDGPSPCWRVHHRGRWSTAPLLVGGCIRGAGRRPLSLLAGSSLGTAPLLVGGCIIGDGPSPCWRVHHRGRWSTAPLLVGGWIIGGAGRRPLSLLAGASSGALVDGPSPCWRVDHRGALVDGSSPCWRVHHRGRWSTAPLLVGGCIIGGAGRRPLSLLAGASSGALVDGPFFCVKGFGARWPSWRLVPLGFQNSTPCLPACTTHSAMRKQRPCPSNTGRWFRQILALWCCSCKGGSPLDPLPHTPPPPAQASPWRGGQRCIGRGDDSPPPLFKAPGSRPATASLTPSASLDGVCNRQKPPPTALATSPKPPIEPLRGPPLRSPLMHRWGGSPPPTLLPSLPLPPCSSKSLGGLAGAAAYSPPPPPSRAFLSEPTAQRAAVGVNRRRPLPEGR